VDSDVFGAVVDRAQLHPSFVSVDEQRGHAAAREMIRRTAADFVDTDGNFAEQFQTTGFDQRIWELYLFAYFRSAGYAIDSSHAAPDFVLSRDRLELTVEATTANPSGGQPANAAPTDEEELREFIKHELPIRLGSPLFSKLTRAYWDLPPARNRPFCLAIESFATSDSLHFSENEIGSYLFGLETTWHHDRGGRLHVVNRPFGEHVVGSKRIPSGFFAEPGADHVSAVLFSNAGTVGKFGRMGFQDGIGRDQIRVMIRGGTAYDHDPDSVNPRQFTYEVGSRRERWGEGLVVFHNPGALHPLDDGAFPDATHYRVDDTIIHVSSAPALHASQSITIPIVAV
jgi:hypothetical protein